MSREIKSYNVLNSSLDKLIIALDESSENVSDTTSNSTSSNNLINHTQTKFATAVISIFTQLVTVSFAVSITIRG